ncbi:MAG TPA: transposase [Micromonosporaceae bacterium]|nr:transposase [Micromonosporaceae bacterium]
MRVYCGLATTESPVRSTGDSGWLTAAVVDDAGRLLDLCDITDDACGYAELGGLLAERSGGTTGVAVAADTDEHEVTMLLLAAGRPLAIADDETVGDYAERFADDESVDEISAGTAERNAVGLARALQAGALAAASRGAPRELMALGPVLAAHAAVAVSRHGSAVALREVLRELYPAALRAYPDPAAPIPLAILDALPEPGLLGISNRGRDAAVAADLSTTGIADTATIADAITALRIAASETPRRTGIGKGPTSAVAETIRQAVAAVRACDAAVAALVGLLAAQDLAPRRAEPTRLRAVAPRAIEATRFEPAQREDKPYGSARHAASRAETTHSGPVSPEPARYESGRESARPEPVRADAARFDPAWQESARYDAARASRRSRSAGAASGPPARPGAMPSAPTFSDGGPTAQPGVRPAAAQAPSAAEEAPPRPNRTPPQRSARSSSRSAPARVDDDFSTPLAPGPVPTADVDLFAMPEMPVSSAGGGLRSSWHDETESPSHGAPPNTGPSSGPTDSPGTALVPSDYDRIYRDRARSTVAYPAAGRPATPVSNYPVEPRYLGDASAIAPDTATRGYEADSSRTSGHRAAEDRQRGGHRDDPWIATREPSHGRRAAVDESSFAGESSFTGEPMNGRSVANDASAYEAPRPGAYPTPGVPAPGSRSNWPVAAPDPADDMARTHSDSRSAETTRRSTQPTAYDRENSYESGIPRQRDGRVAPPWQTEDLAPPAEPPTLRVVEPPVLRLVGRDDERDSLSRRAHYADDQLPPLPPLPVDDEPDDDLLIFAQARSAWFVDPHGDEEAAPSWSEAADQGWSAAERAAHPSIDGETEVGLPRRVPKANLVPGSPLPPVTDDGLRIVRDPAAMAAHTTGYFRGSRRGEEVRGYAVGGRPGRESGEGWDFSRDGWETDREPEYRSAAHR